MDCVFCKVIKGELPSTKLYEDARVVVIKDIHPQAPIHLLIIPKEHITEFYNLEGAEPILSLQNAIKKVIDEQGLMGKGYMIRAFGGGAQEVDHLHFHLLSPIQRP